MERVLTIIAFIFFAGVLAPFLVTSGCLLLERQLEKRREFRRAEVLLLTDEILAGTFYGLISDGFIGRSGDGIGEADAGGENEWLTRDSVTRGLKALVVLHLRTRHLRFIKSEYGDCDKWIEKRIRIFLHNQDSPLFK